MAEQLIIDAENAVLGRIAAFAAKQALQGRKIAILNCEKAVISGKQNFILRNYTKKFSRGKGRLKGPFFIRTPTGIMKRTIRGMLPYKQYRGKIALKSIKCYEGIPAEFEKVKKVQIASDVRQFITLKQLCELIGK